MKKSIAVGLVLFLLLGWSLPILADELKNAQQQKNSVDSEINRVIQQKKAASTEAKKLESEIKKLDKQNAQESAVYQALLNELDMLEEEIIKIEQAVIQAENEYNRQKELFKERLRVMYENSCVSTLETLLKSKNLVEFFERVEYMSLISKKDRQLIEALNAAKLDVEYKKRLKEEVRLEIEEKAKEKEERLEEIKASRSAAEIKLKSTRSKISRLEQQEDQLLKRSNELVKIIKDLSKKRNYIGGNMVWPVPSCNEIVSGYGMRIHPIYKKYKMHTGIDIDGRYGAAIVAANSGTVILAQWQDGYGYTVIVDHGGGIATLYAHCSKILVDVGQEVKAGQTIAKIGSTGISTGPHLHFEVRKEGKTVDPELYVSP